MTLDEVRGQARISDVNSDSQLNAFIGTAASEAEDYLGRGLLTQTWQLVLDHFANVIPLPMAAPLQSVTSVTYYDDAGVQQTLSTSIYDIDTVSRPGHVVLKAGQAWPTVQSERRNGRVTITYIVGWTTPDAIPERIKQGIRQYCTYLDGNRDGMDAIGGLAALQAAQRCWSDRIWWTPPRWTAWSALGH